MTTPPIKPAPTAPAAAPVVAARKTPARKAAAKKAAPGRAAPAKKAPAQKAPAQKSPVKKPAAPKTAAVVEPAVQPVVMPAAAPAKLAVVPDAPSPAQSAADETKPLVAINLPFVSASLTIPGPGAKASVGPVSVTLPTGVLYYGGVGALAVAGAIEWPIALGLGASGYLYRRFSHRGK